MKTYINNNELHVIMQQNDVRNIIKEYCFKQEASGYKIKCSSAEIVINLTEVNNE